MTNQREAFEKWWGCKPQEYQLDMTTDERLFMWVWGAWQAAQADQAERVKELEKAGADLLRINMERTTENSQLQLENQKMRDALDRLARLGNKPNFGNSKGNDIAREALGEIK